jgi:hypothetical protein
MGKVVPPLPPEPDPPPLPPQLIHRADSKMNPTQRHIRFRDIMACPHDDILGIGHKADGKG